MIYCVDDDQYNAVGTLRSEGRKSPFRMDVTTFADQNRLHTQFRGKSIGIAIKDRGAILPAGPTARGASVKPANKIPSEYVSSVKIPIDSNILTYARHHT